MVAKQDRKCSLGGQGEGGRADFVQWEWRLGAWEVVAPGRPWPLRPERQVDTEAWGVPAWAHGDQEGRAWESHRTRFHSEGFIWSRADALRVGWCMTCVRVLGCGIPLPGSRDLPLY